MEFDYLFYTDFLHLFLILLRVCGCDFVCITANSEVLLLLILGLVDRCWDWGRGEGWGCLKLRSRYFLHRKSQWFDRECRAVNKCSPTLLLKVDRVIIIRIRLHFHLLFLKIWLYDHILWYFWCLDYNTDFHYPIIKWHVTLFTRTLITTTLTWLLILISDSKCLTSSNSLFFFWLLSKYCNLSSWDTKENWLFLKGLRGNTNTVITNL